MSKTGGLSTTKANLLALFHPATWKKSVLDFINSKVAFLDSQGAYIRFDKTSPNMITPPWLLILPRSAYSESWSSYPIVSLTELKKILKQQDGEQLRYHFFSAPTQGNRKVLSVSPKSEWQQQCLASVAVLPVTLLLAIGTNKRLLDVTFSGKRFYCFVDNPFAWQSLPYSELINNADKAASLLGATEHIEQQQITQSQINHLLTKLWRLSPGYWLSAINKKRPTAKLLMPLLTTSTLFVTLFFLVSTAYLSWQTNERQQQSKALDTSVQQALNYRNEIDYIARLVALVNEQQPRGSSELAIWDLIAIARQQDAYLSNVQSDFLDVTLQGDSVSATALLEQFLQLPYVDNAGFIAPVRRIQTGREQFLIGLSLKPATFPQDNLLSTPESDVQ